MLETGDMGKEAPLAADGRVSGSVLTTVYEHHDERHHDGLETDEIKLLDALQHDDLVTVLSSEADATTEAAKQTCNYFRHLKNAQDPAREGLCIVEGPEPIRLMLESTCQSVALLLKPHIYMRLRQHVQAMPAERRPHIVIMPWRSITALVGYNLRRGALGCARIPHHQDEAWLFESLLTRETRRWRLVAVDGCNNAANMGSIIRTAAALDMDALLISSDSVDPWYRQCVRVSMGHIFRMPCIRCDDLAATLIALGTVDASSSADDAAEVACPTFAGVIDADAPSLSTMPRLRSSRWCVVVGSEAHGITQHVRDACTTRLRIPMRPGVDSMAINVAAAILMNGLRERDLASASKDDHA